jgi:putative SbcD/Mre11-related phosphoesterase
MFLLKLKILTPYSALVLGKKSSSTLVISDLHIGWEIQLSKQGIHVPSQMIKILNKLLQIIELTNPKTLVILGDIKHTVSRVEMVEWRDIPQFFEDLMERISNIMIVPGNHDGNLEALVPKEVEIHPSSGIIVEGVGLLHGHAWPSTKLFGCKGLVIGHIHPTIVLQDSFGYGSTKQVWIKTTLDMERMIHSYMKYLKIECVENKVLYGFQDRFKVTPNSRRVIIMPSFNDYMGGKPLNKNRSPYGGYLGPITRFMDLDEAEVHLLDGSFLGHLSQLKKCNS